MGGPHSGCIRLALLPEPLGGIMLALMVLGRAAVSARESG